MVPEKSPFYKSVFPRIRRFPKIRRADQVKGVRFGKVILIPEDLLNGSKSSIRPILRHELLHLLLGKGEIVAYAFSLREKFEKCPNQKKMEEKLNSIIGNCAYLRKKAAAKEEKKYYHQKALGAYAAYKQHC